MVNPKKSVASGAQPIEAYLHISSVVALRKNGNKLNVIMKPEYFEELQASFFGQSAIIESITAEANEIEQ